MQGPSQRGPAFLDPTAKRQQGAAKPPAGPGVRLSHQRPPAGPGVAAHWILNATGYPWRLNLNRIPRSRRDGCPRTGTGPGFHG